MFIRRGFSGGHFHHHKGAVPSLRFIDNYRLLIIEKDWFREAIDFGIEPVFFYIVRTHCEA